MLDRSETEIYIGCTNGAAYKVPCREVYNGQGIYVSQKDLPPGAKYAFNDGLQWVGVEETGKFFEILPEIELGVGWYFPKASDVIDSK